VGLLRRCGAGWTFWRFGGLAGRATVGDGGVVLMLATI